MDDPWIRRVAPALEPATKPSEALVYIQGYLSDRDDSEERQERWVECLRAAGWRGSVYHLWWDASSLRGFGKDAIQGRVLHWWKVKSRAKRVGVEHVESLIRENVNEQKISLVGHSLGARVAYYAVLNSKIKLENVVLLGGAIRRDSSREWGDVADRLDGKLVNVYNESDIVLTALTKSINLRQNPCGRKPIKQAHPKIINVEDRDGDNHSHYKRHMLETVGPILWAK